MELWAVARFDLGLSEEEYREMGMIELRALAERFQAREERDDRRVAMICATFANVMCGSKDNQFKLEDFMPKRQEPKKSSDEEAFNLLQEMNAAFGGRVE